MGASLLNDAEPKVVSSYLPKPLVSYCFGYTNRLHNAQSYQRVFDAPQFRVGGQHFLFLIKPNGLTFARLGLVVGKKNVRHAVDRNRVKRILREVFRHQQHHLTGQDIVVIAKRGAGLDKPNLNNDIGRMFTRLTHKIKA